MDDFYCPTCKASPLITDYCPTCSRIPTVASEVDKWVKSLPEYKPDAFGARLSAEGVNRLGDTIADLRMEVARLRVIEDAAVACSEHPVWDDDQFYRLMTELQRALRGEVGDDKTANVKLRGPEAALSPEAPLDRRVGRQTKLQETEK